MIPIAKPLIGEEEKEAVLNVLDSGVIAQGPVVEEFEKNFAECCGAEYAVAVNSGTAALHVALMSMGLKQGDEVIVTPMTFAATINVVEHVGAKPIFVDIEDDSYNISPEEIEKSLNKNVKAIIPVHFAGLPCEMDKINKIAKDNNILVIEDAAHALGAEYNLKKINLTAQLRMFERSLPRLQSGQAIADLKQNELKLEQTHADLNLVNFQLENCKIKSPVTGTVLTPDIEEKVGSLLIPGAPFCEISDLK